MVRPTAAQLQQMEPLAVNEVIAQPVLAAQDTYTAASLYMIPQAGTPILATSLGGALGMAIVDAQIKSEAKHFAESHVQPLRVALQGFDADAALSDSLRQALAGQPALFGHYALQGGRTAPVAAAPGMLVETSYSMTADFSAVQVIATVSIHASGDAGGQPVYRNVLVYQSPRLSIPPKTPADIEQMVAQENARYAALDIDAQIQRANDALAKHDPEVGRLRDKITEEQFRHRQNLAAARFAIWGPDIQASRLCLLWAKDDGAALKAALRASGAEIAHMLQLDLAGQAVDANATSPRTVFQDGTRSIEYLRGGRMISLASSDTDAAQKKAAAPVFMVAPPVRR